MPDQSLRGFLASLQQSGEIVRFTKEVDVDENVSALGWQTFAKLGKGCLFENIKGHPGWRVVSQIVADRRKWGHALGVPENEVVQTMGERIAKPLAPIMVDKKDAPVKGVIKIGAEVDLRTIPAMWTSEEDPGRYIASGMCVIKDPETGIRNVSIHRAQITGPDTTGYLICPRQALKIYQMYGAKNKPMEVAMVIGGHPALAFAAGFVAPYGQDEWTIAGGLLGEPIRLVKCETVDLEVPADAELVLEGELRPGEMTEEGPFGEVTGGYAQEGSTPMFRVKAITYRKDPIFYAMQCGLPPSDTHSIICSTIEMRLWQHLKNVARGLDLIDIRCIATMTPMMVVLKMRSKFPGQARAACWAALSSPYLHPKIAVAVDEDIDIRDLGQVFWAIANRVADAGDMQKIDRTRVFALDNPSPIEPGMSAMYRIGTKVMIDATQPHDRRSARRTGTKEAARAAETAIRTHIQQIEGGLDLLDVRCYPETDNKLLVIKMRGRMEGQSKTACLGALSAPDISPRLVIAVDDDIDIDDLREVAWSFASRVHAEYDIAAIDGLPVNNGAGLIEPVYKWFVDATRPPLTQPAARKESTRAIPKNVASVKLDDFLPE